MATTTNKLPPEYIQSVLRYDPATGFFFWKKKTSSKIVVGKKTGSLAGNGYIYIRIQKTLYLAHHLAFAIKSGKWPKHEVDHRSGNRSDNSWKNLRLATRQQNTHNMKKTSKNTSGYKGVTAKRGWWKASIRGHGKNLHLGYFPTKELAHAAYCAAAKKFHGEFARFE